MKKIKTLSIALAIAGLVLATLLVAWLGAGKIVKAIFSIGAGGFVLFSVWQLVVMAVLGAAWWAVVPAPRGRTLPVFIWGRLVRDSAASCLPFSPAGGFVLGARAVMLHGVSRGVATISTIVDLTTEFASEIAFAALGLIVLLARTTDRAVVLPAEIGLAVAAVAAPAVLHLQRGVGPIFLRLAQRIMAWVEGRQPDAASQSELADSFHHPARLVLGTAIHFVGWIGKGLGNFIAFRLLGVHIGIGEALAIEGLLHMMLAVVVLVPGYAGVQEAGYVGLGALFGVPPEIALSVSLLRRARDIAIGIPVLLAWQAIEGYRRVRAAKIASPPPDAGSARQD
jgi:putative membrane protein